MAASDDRDGGALGFAAVRGSLGNRLDPGLRLGAAPDQVTAPLETSSAFLLRG
jgi:hypothetical protein